MCWSGFFLEHSKKLGEIAKKDEAEKILTKIKPEDFVILLDERGKNISSPEFAKIIEQNFNNSKDIIFIIGGAFGVFETIFQRANFIWSFSKLVFPHQIVRLILTEQIYRSQEILSGGKYHHE